MRFSTILIAAVSLASSVVLADTHYACLCANKDSGSDVYHADATQKACDAYKARNTGDNYWDKCADCHVTDGENKFCQSQAGTMGGKEFEQYCFDNGANSSICD